MTPQKIFFDAMPLNGSAGVNLPLNNAGWAEVVSARVAINTTATPGARMIVFLLDDADTKVLFNTFPNEDISPNWHAVISLGGGVAQAHSDTEGNQTWFTVPLPVGMLVPPGSFFGIRDVADVDAADSIATVHIVIKG